MIDVTNLSGVAVLGPRTDVVTLVNLSAVAVLGPAVEPEGTPRMDLLTLVEALGVVSVAETGTTKQGDVPTDRPDTELSTGELTTVTEITVTWASGPTTDQLAAFNRTALASPNFKVTHV